jgi:UPF0176 protein
VSHLVLLFYKFVEVQNPDAEVVQQLDWGRELDLKGRVIVAPEGINGTVSGTREAAIEYMRRMDEHPVFDAIQFKTDEHSGHAFKRLSVKLRPEIVTLGQPVDTIRNTGMHLGAREFREMLDQPEALVLDIRNDYEYAMGRFRGAIRPPVESFREFPAWVAENFGDAKERPILTYCTGGIRCEKFTAYMVEQGFRNVFQLDGGIVTYAKDPTVRGEGFEGDCFMFDDRLSVPVGPPVSQCEECRKPSSRYVNCDNVDCNRLYFLCEYCEGRKGLACSAGCGGAVRRRQPNARLKPELRSEGDRLRQQRHRAKRRAASKDVRARITLET